MLPGCWAAFAGLGCGCPIFEQICVAAAVRSTCLRARQARSVPSDADFLAHSCVCVLDRQCRAPGRPVCLKLHTLACWIGDFVSRGGFRRHLSHDLRFFGSGCTGPRALSDFVYTCRFCSLAQGPVDSCSLGRWFHGLGPRIASSGWVVWPGCTGPRGPGHLCAFAVFAPWLWAIVEFGSLGRWFHCLGYRIAGFAGLVSRGLGLLAFVLFCVRAGGLGTLACHTRRRRGKIRMGIRRRCNALSTNSRGHCRLAAFAAPGVASPPCRLCRSRGGFAAWSP